MIANLADNKYNQMDNDDSREDMNGGVAEGDNDGASDDGIIVINSDNSDVEKYVVSAINVTLQRNSKPTETNL